MSTTAAGFSARITALVAQMTLEEKVSLLAGASMWNTVPVERLGVPAIKVTDGPNGARGDSGFGTGRKAAAMPVGISLASTWNPERAADVGAALAEEALSKGANVLLGPTTNMHRSPLNGRNFECYSEDPHLAARLTVAYINGVQSKGVGATVKHYAANDSEFERNTISSEVGERALREIYLPPFEAAVREAGTWAIMSAYNKVNGTFASEHRELLTDILRDEWGFDGIVMSDWWGSHSAAPSVNAGLDLEMPGPTLHRGAKLLEAVHKGEVSEETVTASALRILHLLERTGVLDRPEIPAEQELDRPEHRAIARRAAAEGIVLLKNEDNILPLAPAQLKSIALIGPNVQNARIMGGGSAIVNAFRRVTPFEGISEQVGEQVEVAWAAGCSNHKMLPVLDMNRVRTRDGQTAGAFSTTYFASKDLTGDAVATTADTGAEQWWMGPPAAGVNPTSFSARMQGTFVPEVSGDHFFSLSAAGNSRLFVDGALLVENWESAERGDTFFGMGTAERIAQIPLTAGQPVDLTIEFGKVMAAPLSAVRVGCMPVPPVDAMAKAAELAAQADIALLFVGTTQEWETEGVDRAGLSLPGEQDALIAAVAAANPRTVVVLQTGGPVAMPWFDKVAGVVQAWFSGQECGHAIADVLLGRMDATGRLPQTFPLRIEDNPAFINYPGENGRVHYGEGIFIGYRYYEKKQVPVLFPFGYGLSYTTFAYNNLQLSSQVMGPDETLTVTVDVTNTGGREGSEVVQLYVRDVASTLTRPEKELKGFVKVWLAPGETGKATLTLDRRSLACWDDRRHEWVAEAGDFVAMVGRSSAAIELVAEFRLSETVRFDGPAKGTAPEEAPARPWFLTE